MCRNFRCVTPMHLRAVVVVALLGVCASDVLFTPPVSAADEIKVRHILVRKRTEAETALDELVNLGVTRENFIRMARKHSMDPVTKGAGGDLGWNTPQKFVKEFSDEAFGLQAGEVSEPVRTEFGWHIIYVEDRRDTRNRPTRDARTLPPSVFNPGGDDTAVPTGAATSGTASTPEATPTAVTPTQVTPVPETKKPSPSALTPTTPERPTPQARLPQKRLNIALEPEQHFVPPTHPIRFSLVLENLGKEDLKFFHPQLLPLGVAVRSDLEPKKPTLDIQAVPETESLVVDLKSQDVLGKFYSLNDYYKELPIDTRLWLKWDSQQFLTNFEKRFPGKSSEVSGFAEAKQLLTGTASELNKEILGVFENLNRPGTPRFIQEAPVATYSGIGSRGDHYARIDIEGEKPLWFKLYNKEQPEGVRHFTDLALQGFYDGLFFFDIQEGNYARAGCPRNDGTGTPRRLPRVSNREHLKHERGTLSLVTRRAAIGRGTVAGSIFFISLKEHPEWDEIHLPIGKLALGEETLEKIKRRTRIETVAIVPVEKAPPELGGTVAASPTTAEDQTSQETTTTQNEAKADEPTIIEGRGLPKVLVETSKGNMTVELFQDDARNTVFNFISLIEKGVYTGPERSEPMKVLEKQPGYYIRTGSPDNSDTAGPGYRITNETASNTRGHELGTLSMCLEVDSSTGKPVPNTAGSQFFMCLGEVAFWNGLYTPFGRVIEGQDVLTKLAEGDTILSMKVLAKRRGQYNPTTQPVR